MFKKDSSLNPALNYDTGFIFAIAALFRTFSMMDEALLFLDWLSICPPLNTCA